MRAARTQIPPALASAGCALRSSCAARGVPPTVSHREDRSRAANGVVTVVRWQQVGKTRYLDAAGFPGKTVGW